jgi:hypothetical protein
VIAFVIHLYFADKARRFHLLNEFFNFVRVRPVRQFAIGRAGDRMSVCFLVVKIHEIQQFHQLGPSQMHIVDALQKIKNHLLKFFLGIVGVRGAHNASIKQQIPALVNLWSETLLTDIENLFA